MQTLLEGYTAANSQYQLKMEELRLENESLKRQLNSGMNMLK